jgi:hypothetical protein
VGAGQHGREADLERGPSGGHPPAGYDSSYPADRGASYPADREIGYPAARDSGYAADLGREATADYDSDRFVPPYVADPAAAGSALGDYFTRAGPDRTRAWDQEPGTVAFPQSPSGRAFETDSGQYLLGSGEPRSAAGGAGRQPRDLPDSGRIARDQFERDRFGAPYDRTDRADLLPPDVLQSEADRRRDKYHAGGATPLDRPGDRDTVAEQDYRGHQGREPRPRHGRDSDS